MTPEAAKGGGKAYPWADALRKAKALIPDERHWWRGPKTGPRPDGCHCVVTACLEQGSSYIVGLFERVIQQNAATWQDSPATTFADLQAAFDLAIEACA